VAVSRWLRWIGPASIALAGAAIIGFTTLGAGPAPWSNAVACDASKGDPVPTMLSRPSSVDRTWFDLEPVLDEAGTLRGQRLTVGSLATTGTQTVDLPPESSVAGPFGGAVLVGSDDGRRSRLELIDGPAGCRWTLGEADDVIRRATLDRARAGVIEMRVDRASRADLGIWFRPLDGLRPVRRLLEPIEEDTRFGRTWSTEFGWADDGERLVVQSCGEVACRIRVLALDSGEVAVVAEPDLGSLIGIDGDRVVTYRACRGLPCPIVSTDLATGARQRLADAAGSATMIGPDDALQVVFEVGTLDGRRLASVSADGRTTDLGAIAVDRRLDAIPGRPGDGDRLPAGLVLVVPVDPASGPGRPEIFHIADGSPSPSMR
jgi:hypothetical protein